MLMALAPQNGCLHKGRGMCACLAHSGDVLGWQAGLVLESGFEVQAPWLVPQGPVPLTHRDS